MGAEAGRFSGLGRGRLEESRRGGAQRGEPRQARPPYRRRHPYRARLSASARPPPSARRRTVARHRPPRPSRRRAKPTPRRSRISRAARTACRSCLRARSAPTALGSDAPIRPRCMRAFDGVRFDPRTALRARPRPRTAPTRRSHFAALIERSGARPADQRRLLRPRSLRGRRARPFPADWAAHVEPFVDAALALKAKGFAGPSFVADARSVHAAGGSPSQELAFALGAGVSLLRALDAAGAPLDEARA